MGFNSVYRALQEVFPQVDGRMLKAVAIEHSKDADAAVEFILLEVLPFMSEQSVTHGPSYENLWFKDLPNGRVGSEEHRILLKPQLVCEDGDASPSSRSGSVDGQDDDDTDKNNCAVLYHSTILEESLKVDSVPNFSFGNGGPDQACGNSRTEDLQSCEELHVSTGYINTSQSSSVSLIQGECSVNSSLNDNSCVPQLSTQVQTSDSPECDLWLGSVSHVSSSKLTQKSNDISGCLNNISQSDLGLSDAAVTNNFSTPNDSKCHLELLSSNGNQSNVGNSVALLTPYGLENIPDVSERGIQSEFDSSTSIIESDKTQLCNSFDTAFKNEASIVEMVDIEGEVSSNTTVARPGETCQIELLENIIEDARSSKKNLFSVMESVINLMREVELQEKAAEQAKEEAAEGGVHVLARVEELKQLLRHAKDANDMHAGEIYGEKSILATEARELQARLLSLSEERDRSLAILDEMRSTIEVRLATAEDERKAAEQEKLDKENLAREALAEQELIMEKVVGESKRLQQEAEENSKLRDFLMDRGRLVDTLQGEISVICQDVKLLKEKFDERVPLSQSISSGQKSCVLASSSSSLKSLAFDRVPEQAESYMTSTSTSPTPSIDGEAPKSTHGDNRARDDCKELLDDGWDVFDKDTELYR